MNPLWKGAIKSAISSACGVIAALPPLDPEHFDIRTTIGWSHLLGLILWMTVIAEARYWKEWADKADKLSNGGIIWFAGLLSSVRQFFLYP